MQRAPSVGSATATHSLSTSGQRPSETRSANPRDPPLRQAHRRTCGRDGASSVRRRMPLDARGVGDESIVGGGVPPLWQPCRLRLCAWPSAARGRGLRHARGGVVVGCVVTSSPLPLIQLQSLIQLLLVVPTDRQSGWPGVRAPNTVGRWRTPPGRTPASPARGA